MLQPINLVIGTAWLIAGLVCIGLSLPLIAGQIGRNSLYGVRFPESFASDEAWFATDDGFVVKFKQDGVETRADYNKKGNWLHTIRTYDENRLPEDIRHLVKSSYYDYDILQVQEIEKPSNTFTYIVHLEGKTKFINLRITDENMEEWQKFDKSK